MNTGRFMNTIKSFTLIGTLSIVLVSCLKDNTEDNSALYAQQFASMIANVELNADFTKWEDSTGYNVEMYFITKGSDTTKATGDNAVLISFDSYDYEGIIGTSNDSTAKKHGLYRGDIIYGPTRVWIKYALPGLYVALQKMPENSKAVIIIPSAMAANSGPLKYVITMHKIIKDFTAYETQQREAYGQHIGFVVDTNSTESNAIDGTLWYKLKGTGNHTIFTPIAGEIILIELTANYCEYIPELISVQGRQFFPINNSTDSVRYSYEFTTDFPITPAIDSMIFIMGKTGYREAEFITTSGNAYETVGFVHPYLGTYIVPPYMSVHYTMKWLNGN